MRHDLLLQPSSDQGGECGQMNSPNYVNNCNYDGAYNVLAKVNHYYRTMQNILLVPDGIQSVYVIKFQTLGSIQNKNPGESSDEYDLR